MNRNAAKAFSREEVRAAVIPAYMGVIKQIDDHFTSDHSDYVGDHWLGEKELFHEQAARIPLIVYDPDAEADATRGRVDD